MISKRLSLCALALGAAIISSAFAAAPPEERAKTEGFAIVRVVHNGGITFNSVVVQETGGKERRRALDRDYRYGIDAENFATYAGWLEPGEYRLHSLATAGAAYVGAFVGSIDLAALEFPAFTVEAGKMLDLGTLLQQPIGGDRATVVPWNGEHAYDDLGDHADLAKAAPAFRDPPLRWNGVEGWTYRDVELVGGAGDLGTGGFVGTAITAAIGEATTVANKPTLREQWSRAESASALVALSKQATIVMGQPELGADGTAYFPSALGQILRRAPAGEWTNLDTGTMDRMSAVLVDGNNLYASSFQHRLFASTDGGATWQSAQPPIAPSVAAIARLPNGDFVAAAEVPPKGKVMQLLRGPDFLALPAAPWKELKAQRGWSTAPVLPFSGAVVAPSPNQLVVWTGDRLLQLYDAANDRWTAATAPGAINKLYVNRSTGLVYYSGPVVSAGVMMAGLRLNNGAISADGGKTWQELDIDRHAGLGFRDRMNGIAIIADFEGFKPELFTATTADGGATWTRFEGQVPGFCVTSAYLPPTGELICMRNDGNIMSTRTGDEWVVERAVL